MTALLDRYIRWLKRLLLGTSSSPEIDRADVAFALWISACLLVSLLAFPVVLVLMAVL